MIIHHLKLAFDIVASLAHYFEALPARDRSVSQSEPPVPVTAIINYSFRHFFSHIIWEIESLLKVVDRIEELPGINWVEFGPGYEEFQYLVALRDRFKILKSQRFTKRFRQRYSIPIWPKPITCHTVFEANSVLEVQRRVFDALGNLRWTSPLPFNLFVRPNLQLFSRLHEEIEADVKNNRIATYLQYTGLSDYYHLPGVYGRSQREEVEEAEVEATREGIWRQVVSRRSRRSRR